METKEKTMEVLAGDLEKEMRLTQSVLDASSEILMEMGSAGEYTRASDNYACASLMMFHFTTLERVVKEGYKKTESFIRFTIYQIERTTDRRILECDVASSDRDCFLVKSMAYKSTLYRTFKRFLTYFDEDSAKSQTNITKSLAGFATAAKAI